MSNHLATETLDATTHATLHAAALVHAHTDGGVSDDQWRADVAEAYRAVGKLAAVIDRIDAAHRQ